MRKALALLFIVILAVPALGCGSYGCNNPPASPFTNPPTTSPGTGGGNTGKCPIDALKLGACLDLLSGLVHVHIGDPVVNKCCPLIKGVAGLEAALCFCTTIKAKLLNLNVLLPLSLELVATCGLTVPQGFKCPSN